MSAWGHNHVTIRNRWPRVAAELETSSIEECAIGGEPFPALQFRGKQITSSFDPMSEAHEQAEGLERGGPVYCYGIGLGYLPGVLAARHDHVYVVLPNLSIARAAFESVEMPWLFSPNVSVKTANELDTFYSPFACVPMECWHADTQGHALRDRLFAKLDRRVMADVILMPREKADAKHVDGNLVHTDKDPYINTLFGTRRGQRVVIVGGGPTLTCEFEWLRERVSGLTVIATTSVLRVLLENDITPTIVVVVDTDPKNIAQLDGVDLDRTRDIMLAYHPQVTPKIMAAWRGRRCFYGYDLFHGGTVMHICADLAVKMGAAEVVMVGMDFCYPGSKSHAEGTPDYHEVEDSMSKFQTVDGNGQSTYTDRNLAMYHRHLEDFIARTPSVRWVKRGRAGVPVRGATWE